MQVKMKRGEIFQAASTLVSLEKLQVKRRLAYAIAKNKNTIDSELKAIDAARKFSGEDREDFIAWRTKARETAEKYAARDENDKPITTGGNMRLANPQAYQDEMSEYMLTVCPQLKADFEAHDKEVESFLSSEVSLDLHDMYLDDLPDQLTAASLGGLVDWFKVE
jgi:hypothetical protein